MEIGMSPRPLYHQIAKNNPKSNNESQFHAYIEPYLVRTIVIFKSVLFNLCIPVIGSRTLDWQWSGIGPDRLLYDKFNVLSKVIEVMLKGIGLERWLLDRSRDSNCCKLPILSGILPISWFQKRFKANKFDRFVISFGISPHKLLLEGF
ncbi:unnamed protein product, partial [Prunus brigantina]